MKRTATGRVVYDRATHYFGASDLLRVTKAVDPIIPTAIEMVEGTWGKSDLSKWLSVVAALATLFVRVRFGWQNSGYEGWFFRRDRPSIDWDIVRGRLDPFDDLELTKPLERYLDEGIRGVFIGEVFTDAEDEQLELPFEGEEI